MKARILEINQGEIQLITGDDFDADHLNEKYVYVYQIISDNLSEISKELAPFCTDKHILNSLNEPEKHTHFHVRNEIVYGQLALFSADPKKDMAYLGILIKSNILFIIQFQTGEVLSDILNTIMLYPAEQRADISKLLFIILDHLLSSQAEIGVGYRIKVEDLAKKVDEDISKIIPRDILNMKSNLYRLSNVLVQQYLTFNFPQKRVLHDEDHPYISSFLELVHSLEIQRKSLVGIEQRLDSVHNHYFLLLQEKSNKRINLLTIVQAVFVPLTVIVGIYGMNFNYMPELEWRYAYFACLSLMVLLVLIEIRYFYKHGWFK